MDNLLFVISITIFVGRSSLIGLITSTVFRTSLLNLRRIRTRVLAHPPMTGRPERQLKYHFNLIYTFEWITHEIRRPHQLLSDWLYRTEEHGHHVDPECRERFGRYNQPVGCSICHSMEWISSTRNDRCLTLSILCSILRQINWELRI